MDEKLENIKRLLDINGYSKSAENTVNQVLTVIKNLKPEFDETSVDVENLKEIVEDLKNRIIPIYENHLTNEEILGFIDFYESDLGKSYLTKMGKITMETMELGEKFGEIIFNKIMKIDQSSSSS